MHIASNIPTFLGTELACINLGFKDTQLALYMTSIQKNPCWLSMRLIRSKAGYTCVWGTVPALCFQKLARVLMIPALQCVLNMIASFDRSSS